MTLYRLVPRYQSVNSSAIYSSISGVKATCRAQWKVPKPQLGLSTWVGVCRPHGHCFLRRGHAEPEPLTLIDLSSLNWLRFFFLYRLWLIVKKQEFMVSLIVIYLTSFCDWCFYRYHHVRLRIEKRLFSWLKDQNIKLRTSHSKINWSKQSRDWKE